jgi:hypothetical protein
MLDTFGIFIDKVCKNDDQEWFTRHRRRVLKRLKAEATPAGGG